MQSTRIAIINHINIPCRYIRSSGISYRKNNLGEQSRFIQKLMNKNSLKRKWFIPPVSTSPTSAINPPKKVVTHHKSRRMAALDKVFMRYISDLMSTGEVSKEVLNRGIEITSVNVTPNFKLVNVFWVTQNDELQHEISTEQILHDCARILRHELSNLRVIGVVPPIQFVKDKTYLFTKEVENRLAQIQIANQVESTYDPWELIEDFKLSKKCISNEPTVQPMTSTPSEIIDEELPEVLLPEMTHNVFGLDHYKIMTEIKTSLEKVRNAKKKRLEKNDSQSTLVDEQQNRTTLVNVLNRKEQDQLFAKFLARRKKEEILKRKAKEIDITSSNILTANEDYYSDEVDSDSDMCVEDDLK